VTKDEGKAEVFNAAFATVFNSNTSCCLSTQPPDLEDRVGEQNEAPTSQWKCLVSSYSTETHRGVWGRMGSTQGYWGSWQRCLL